MGQFASYTIKTTVHASDIILLADSQDTDSDGDYKTKRFLGGLIPTDTDTKADQTMEYAAGSFDYPTTNPAPLDTDTGTNGTIKRQLMDDTTEEFVIGQGQICSDIDLTGTVTFEAYGYASTAASSKNIELTYRHSAKTDAESWDAAYTTTISGDLSLVTTQDLLDRHSWTNTVSNLGWAANDHIRFKLSRTAPTANDLTGDYGVTHFRVRIPRS